MATPEAITESELWAAVDQARAIYATEQKPPGSFTVGEYAEKYGLNASTARRQVEGLVSSGKLCRVRILMLDQGGVNRHGWAYRPMT